MAAADNTPGAGEKWLKLIRWFRAVKQLREAGQDVEYPVLAFMDFFVDDTPSVAAADTDAASLRRSTCMR